MAKKQFNTNGMSSKVSDLLRELAREIAASGLDQEIHWKQSDYALGTKVTAEIKWKPSKKKGN